MRLKHKVSIVTGAGSGIGRAIAIRFAQEGSKVVIDDLNSSGGNETVACITRQGGEAFFVKADVSNGPLDVLVNSAIPSTIDGQSWKRTWRKSESKATRLTMKSTDSV